VSGGGMNALRGIRISRGLTDLGLLSNQLPGYISLPSQSEQDYAKYLATRTLKPLRSNQLSYWQNTPEVLRELHEDWWGDAATEQTTGYDYLPKLDKLYDMLQVYELMHQGKINGYLAQGFNPLCNAAPNKAKITAAFLEAQFLVIMDPLATEPRVLAQLRANSNDVDRASSDRGVSAASTCFAEETAPGQIGTLAAVALKGANPLRRGAQRFGHHGGYFHAHARDVRQGRWRLSSDSQLDLEICANRRVPARKSSPKKFGQRPQRLGRSQGPPRSRARPASSSRASPSCATMAAHNPVADFSAARGVQPAT